MVYSDVIGHRHFVIIFGEDYKLHSSNVYNFPRRPATSGLLGPNITLSTLFSNALNSICYMKHEFRGATNFFHAHVI